MLGYLDRLPDGFQFIEAMEQLSSLPANIAPDQHIWAMMRGHRYALLDELIDGVQLGVPGPATAADGGHPHVSPPVPSAPAGRHIFAFQVQSFGAFSDKLGRQCVCRILDYPSVV